MFEGFYFEFPKLSFLLFVFLACENLCPLRSQMLYFPHISHFGDSGVKSPAWMWISKWLMIVFLIVALMSPVKEIQEPPRFEGYSTLIVADSPDEEMREKIATFIALRPFDAIALYVPDRVKVPLTKDYEALLSILHQLPKTPHVQIDYTIKEFLSTQERRWIVIFSNHPKTFVHSIPTQIESSVVPEKQWREWMKKSNHEHDLIPIVTEATRLKYLYFYPLFFGFIAMFVYLFGRNQRGFL
ncbi:MAG: VWA domain-containing protein [Sulfuricurvum sp.]|nr:VWA domain-containing protein [Sulfuricurvum sp.]MDD5386222.1 VWA domain-containing protein [Sulfuricurvum sp.]